MSDETLYDRARTRRKLRGRLCLLATVLVISGYAVAFNLWNAEWRPEAGVLFVLLTAIAVASTCFEGWIDGG